MRKLIYICGFGRSGSSIFDLYLTQKYNFFSLGELTYFFERGVINKELCSCGKDIYHCDFWKSIIHDFNEKKLLENAEQYSKLTRKYESTKKFYFYMLFHRFFKDSNFEQYVKLQIQLLKIINQHLNENVILIDSSKFPSRAFWLYKYSKRFDLDMDIKLLHIIRHPVANAYSWTKIKKRPEASNSEKDVYMSKFGFFEALLKWMNNNIASRLLKIIASNDYYCMKYENFCSNTENELISISKHFNIENELNKVISSGYHSISGNPARMENKEIKVKCDDMWKTKLNGIEKLVNSIVSVMYKVRF